MSVIAVAAGGTAGHIEPAIACIKAIKKLDPSCEVFMIGTNKGLEKDLVPQRGIDLTLIPATPFPRKFSIDLLSIFFKVFEARRITQQILEVRKVDCVIGFGAYVSLPVYLAAKKLNIPIIIHEGNKKAGLANRLGARFATEVFQMFPKSIKGAQTIGMPLATEINELDKNKLKSEAYKFFNLDPNKKTLLVFGGSQGARSINTALFESLERIQDLNIQIIHSVGKKNEIPESTKKYDFYHPVPYIEKMHLAYAACDLAISRAGAMTIAEQSVLGIPAIYVPFAVGNGEQIKNVAVLLQDGSGVLLEDRFMNAKNLSIEVRKLISNPNALSAMSQAVLKHGLRDADQKIAQRALALSKQK
jgi:UDP-N-acetylglucosamine--N-acetylmuramyl-(pentapeptide) pyrophosphoryl-undecaprenol N-acetylglucosamine transferase